MTEEVKAYTLELMELCLELGYALDYNPNTQGITIWDYSKAEEGKEVIFVTTAYLDELLTPEVRLVVSIGALKAYDRLKKDLV